MENSQCLTELEPVTLGDNTEVKVPIEVASSGDSVINCAQNDQDDNGSADILEYNRLAKLFSDIPSDLFIPHILKDYASCEQKLMNTRDLLFNSIRSYDDFPYSFDCELKRRMTTRRGDPACIKLANDIHTLLSVLDGSDYSLLKDLISTSRPRSSSQTRRTQDSCTLDKVSHSCQCSHDLSAVQDTVSGLQSEILLLKQQFVAVEAKRTEQSRSLNDIMLGIKTDLKSMFDNVVGNLDDCHSQVRDYVEHELSSIDDKIERIATSVFDNKFAQDNRNQIYAGVTDIPLIPQPAMVDAPVIAMEPNCTFGNALIPPHDSLPANARTQIDHSFPLDGDAPLMGVGTDPAKDQCGDSTRVIRVQVRDQATQTYDAAYWPCPASKLSSRDTGDTVTPNVTPNVANKSNHSVTFAEIISKIGTPSAPRVNGIPVRVTERSDSDSSQIQDDHISTANDDFSVHVRKRSKRFFIGGFKDTMTIQNMNAYVTDRGPRVTMIRRFQSKRSQDDVIFRVNVEINDDVYLVEERGFWPRGVVCKPWLSRGALKARYEASNNAVGHTRYGERQWPRRQTHEYSGVNDECDNAFYTNRYHPIISEVD